MFCNFALVTLALVALVSGAPAVQTRQLGRSANDVANGVCRNTTLLFARGTTEGGNLGTVCILIRHRVKSTLKHSPSHYMLRL